MSPRGAWAKQSPWGSECETKWGRAALAGSQRERSMSAGWLSAWSALTAVSTKAGDAVRRVKRSISAGWLSAWSALTAVTTKETRCGGEALDRRGLAGLGYHQCERRKAVRDGECSMGAGGLTAWTALTAIRTKKRCG